MTVKALMMTVTMEEDAEIIDDVSDDGRGCRHN